jgi:hypothetical protein
MSVPGVAWGSGGGSEVLMCKCGGYREPEQIGTAEKLASM